MTGPAEVMVAGVDAWADKPTQPARLLATPRASIPDPSGRPVGPDQIAYFTMPEVWAENARELADALAFVAGSLGKGAKSTLPTSAGAVSPVEDRLVFTVEEVAQLLGISRSFACEAVQRGEIPSMRIGRRSLVPKAALQRFLDASPTDTLPEWDQRRLGTELKGKPEIGGED
jgi:excisionase family DNA binding protein